MSAPLCTVFGLKCRSCELMLHSGFLYDRTCTAEPLSADWLVQKGSFFAATTQDREERLYAWLWALEDNANSQSPSVLGKAVVK